MASSTRQLASQQSTLTKRARGLLARVLAASYGLHLTCLSFVV